MTKRPPSIPLVKDRKADDTGIYLLNIPIVPKTRAEPIYARTYLLLFVCLLIFFFIQREGYEIPAGRLDKVH